MEKLHFTGIGGAGMAPLAALAKERGFIVSGSDSADSEKCSHLRDCGIEVHIGHDAANLPDDAAMLIYSSAIPENNCERTKAAALGIIQLRRGEYLARLAENFKRCVSVTGTHGKSSITSCLAKILCKCGKDPGFMIGADVAGLPCCSGGNGDIFVTEADESDGTHTLLKNFLAIIPNVEDDHEWSVGGREALENNFRLTASNSQHIIYYASEKCDKLFAGHPSALRLDEIPEKFGDLYGFQAANAFIAFQAALMLGCEEKAALDAVQDYPQVSRRMSVHFDNGDLTVIEDYAHHPTEVRAALELLRIRYPGRHLRTVFQPHRFARLEKYLYEFAGILKLADSNFTVPVFAAWSESGSVNEKTLAELINGTALEGNYRMWAKKVMEDIPPETVIAVLGAGDVNKILPFLCPEKTDQ